MRGTKAIRISYLERDITGLETVIDGLRESALLLRNEIIDQKQTILKQQAGVDTKYEVVTISPSDTRTVRTMTDRFDALNYGSQQRIGGQSVLLYEVETRRRPLYSDGRVISPFGA